MSPIRVYLIHPQDENPSQWDVPHLTGEETEALEVA